MLSFGLMNSRSAVSLALCPLLLWGGVTQAGLIWSVPDDPNGIPQYFSGTNSRAFIAASSAPTPDPNGGLPTLEPTIVKHELWLNDHMISRWEKPANRPNIFTARHHIMFDSAYYAGGNGNGPITVQLKVWEVGDTVPQENSYPVQAINNAIIANRNEWEVKKLAWSESLQSWVSLSGSFFFSEVADDFSLMKRPVIGVSHFRWNAADVLDQLGGKNIVVWNAHGLAGQPGNFQIEPPRVYSGSDDRSGNAPSGPPFTGPGYLIERVNGYRPLPPLKYESGGSIAQWVRVRPWRIEQIGTGLPPFNSLGEPPLNIVLLSVCQAGVVGASDPGLPGDLLYPNGNVYSEVSSFSENQGVVIPFEDIMLNQGGLRYSSLWRCWEQVGE